MSHLRPEDFISSSGLYGGGSLMNGTDEKSSALGSLLGSDHSLKKKMERNSMHRLSTDLSTNKTTLTDNFIKSHWGNRLPVIHK